MATNIKIPGHSVTLRVPVPAGIVSGNPVELVDLHGIAITQRDGNGSAMVKFPFAYVVKLNVEAVNNAGNSAVAFGDKLYYDAAATIKINKDNTNGKGFGYALGTLTAGSSGEIEIGVAAL